MSNVIEGYFGPQKKQRMKAVRYVRDFKDGENLPYEQKFSALFDLCEDAATGAFEVVIVAYPEVLGQTEEEFIRNLSLLSEAGLLVSMAGASPALSQ
jgi:hypothetical protein